MVKHRLFYFIGSCITIILIGIMVFLITIFSEKTPNLKAETTDAYTLTVKKSSTISIYVSGPGVNRTESTSDSDVYEVTKGTLVAFRAVNESMIFTGWDFSPAISDITTTDAYVVFEPTSDLTVSVLRREPSTTDVGQYMNNSFIIQDDTSLVSLASMFNAGNVPDKITEEIIQCYDSFFSNDADYQSCSNIEDKRKGICEIFFNKLQNGYFQVTKSFVITEADFFGIGNNVYPFKGVMCGLYENIANVYINTTNTEVSGDNYSGLFGVIEEEAVIRNLKISTNISFSKNTENADNIFVGGLAGVIKGGAYLYNLTVTTSGAVDSTVSANIYFGGLAGKTEGSTKMTTFGLSDDNQILLELTNCAWTLAHNSLSGKSIMSGGIVGYANNTYIKTVEINVSNYFAKITSISSNVETNTNININDNNCYIGNVFGYCANSIPVEIKNIEIIGNGPEQLQSVISYGNAYVSGCIGYLDSKALFQLGHINFDVNSSGNNSILAKSLDASSRANLYTGGLIAKMTDESIGFVVATKEFSSCINVYEIDGVKQYKYDAIFSGNYDIQSYQNGISDGKTFGKSVAGGLVGAGYINMNGTTDARSEIIISTDSYSFVVNATQSSTSSTSQDGTSSISNDKEHCTAGLVYGLFSTNNTEIKIENTNYYASGFKVTTERSMSSTTGGDLHTGGLVGYSFAANYENITVFFNNAAIQTNSYSYDCKWDETVKDNLYDANNVYTGGLVGEFSGQKGTNVSMKNIKLCGYDYENHTPIGTTLQITSIQNTSTPKEDYSGENYCGGIIGRSYYANVDGIIYSGAESSENYIRMQSNENPDTVFCGGIIGYVKNNDNNSAIQVTVNNCLIENVTIQATGTCVSDNITLPDMYCGGIIGGSFNGGATDSSLEITKCRVYSVEISSIGNERMIVYGAGIIGINTWQGTTTISDCYVYNCKIGAYAYYSSVQNNTVKTYGAGIIAECNTTKTIINNCCVMDTNIISQNYNPEGTIANVAGISANKQNNKSLQISGCYSNASLNASIAKDGSSPEYYGIAKAITTQPDKYSYYIQQLANNISSSTGKSISISNEPIYVESDEDKDILYDLFSEMQNEDKYRNKYYPILSYVSEGFDVNNLDTDNKVIQIIIKKNATNITNIVSLWVNVQAKGNSTGPNTYASDFERHESGWFLFTEIMIQTKDATVAKDNTMTIQNITYPLLDAEYDYNETEDSFINLNSPYDSVKNIGYEESTTEYEANIGSGNDSRNITIKASLTITLYDEIPAVKIPFTITAGESGAIDRYIWTFFSDEGEEISWNETYGSYQYNILESEEGKSTYEFSFSPNTQLQSEVTFYIGFKLEGQEYSDYVFKIHLMPNTIQLSHFKYAEYTIPENWNITDNLGSINNPYVLFKNDVIKIIPVFIKTNDQKIYGQNKYYDEEANITSCDYSLSDESKSYASIQSNGELTTNGNLTNDVVCYVTITLKEDESQTLNVYFKVVDYHTVTFSAIGADVYGLSKTYGETDYQLDISLRINYNGTPKSFDISVGTTTYDKNSVMQEGWIKNQNGETVTAWDANAEKYILTIPNSAIDNDVVINMEFQEIYFITFDSQSQIFNPKTSENHIQTYKVPVNCAFSDFFDETFLNETLYPWINEKSIFGYVFMGFYLIDNASSVTSYGKSLEELIQTDGLLISGPYTFYARWSFLIEIIDSPTTHVKTSFPADYLETYGVDDYGNELSEDELKKLQISRAVTIPINNNQGYVFTIEKDKNFVGEATPEVYICYQNEDTKEVLTQKISIEQYYENADLYRIPAEVITGYLVICTSVSNSEFIVGENTSQIMDSILPEDGVYTFKYVVNHFNQSSYIYNSGIETDLSYNLNLNRDVLLRFYKETYDTNLQKTTLISSSLAKGTIIEVYYHQYQNGEYIQSADVVGTYTVNSDNVTQLKLSDFKKLNKNEDAFQNITFKELLEGKESLSEVYYFVITPPNGYTEYTEDGFGSIVNHYIYVGYYDQNKADEVDPFVKGIRSAHDLVNLPLEGVMDDLMYETSCHIRSYSVTPSRLTKLTKDEEENTYIFKDINTYTIFDLVIGAGNTLSEDGSYIILNEGGQSVSTSMESSIIQDGIMELNLFLGYGSGNLNIYGKTTEDGDWQSITTIYVNSVTYENYVISFEAENKKYVYFKLENTSLAEIHMKGISLSTLNGTTYEFEETDIQNAKISETSDNTTIHMEKDICGDTRHEGKHFVLAVQFKDEYNNIFVYNGQTIKIQINGEEYNPDHSGVGSATIYFDLTKILNALKLDEIKITIFSPTNEYSLSCVELLEAVSIQKPAMSEIRDMFIKNSSDA